ncbi:EamA family transporter [Sphingopyxis panaciterrae]
MGWLSFGQARRNRRQFSRRLHRKAEMSPVVVGLLLASALIHAIWNAIVRNGKDRFWSIAVICLVGAVAALPFALVLGPPARPSWPYLILSALLQIGYSLFLVRAYRDGELSSVYPIARGSAPLLVTLGAALVAGELPNTAALIGIVCVSSGILSLTLGSNRPDRHSAIAAFATGIFIASYMVVDGLGVRLSESAPSYAAWQAVAAGVLIPLSFVIIRRRAPGLPRGKEGALVVGAGILGTLGYCIAVWAMSRSAMGGVSAIRETSILFAALIGTFVLHEKLTVQKIIGALMVTIGVVYLAAA